jgi:uncharacterized membrane protein
MNVSRVSSLLQVQAAMVMVVVLGSGPAAAHWGHIADLGGHAHWAGLALGASAAALAAGLVAVGRAKDEDEDAEVNPDAGEAEPTDA